MIGLGVGIDYTLFIVTRFRQFLHDGLSPQEAAAAAGATAGRAVIFAGVTVAISITGLALIGLDFITKLGIGSALGVLTAVLLANSLLPAVLSLLGDEDRPGPVRPAATSTSRAKGRRGTPIAAWGRFVSRQREGRAAGRARRAAAARLAGARASASGWRTQAPRRRIRRRARRTTCSTSGFGPGLHRADPGRRRHAVRSRRRRQARDGAPDGARARAGRQADLQQEEPRRWHRSRSSTPTGSTSRRTRRPTTSSRTLRHTVIPQTLAGLDRARVRLGIERRVHRHRPPDLLARAVVPALHHRHHVPRAGDGVPLGRDRGQGGADDAALGAGRVRRPDARRPARPRHGDHRPRPHRADRELRAADRVRDPLRALDGLRGVPDEPDPRGARARATTRSPRSRTGSRPSAA